MSGFGINIVDLIKLGGNYSYLLCLLKEFSNIGVTLKSHMSSSVKAVISCVVDTIFLVMQFALPFWWMLMVNAEGEVNWNPQVFFSH